MKLLPLKQTERERVTNAVVNHPITMNLLPLKQTAIEAALAAGKIIRSYMDLEIRFSNKKTGAAIMHPRWSHT